MIKIIPKGDFILMEYVPVKKDLIETVPADGGLGLALPETLKQQEYESIVVAIGPGIVSHTGELIPITRCKVGDRLLIQPNGGMKIPDPNATDELIATSSEKIYVIMREGEVVAVLETVDKL